MQYKKTKKKTGSVTSGPRPKKTQQVSSSRTRTSRRSGGASSRY